MNYETLASGTARLLRLTNEQYWLLKISSRPAYNIVLAGSSRVFTGLSPCHMARVLPGHRILNFGFNSCVLEPRYLLHARSLLYENARTKILVLGISPHTLVRRPADRIPYNEWAESLHIDREVLWRQILVQHLNGQVAKRTVVMVAKHFVRGTKRQRFYANGWVATRAAKFEPMDYVERLESVFHRFQVDSSLIDEMLETVAEFTSQGVRVFGFFPPTNSAMRALEERTSGLDQSALLQGFARSGGIWLDLPLKDYCAFDGSHLDHVQAKQLSRQVALMIKAHQERLP